MKSLPRAPLPTTGPNSSSHVEELKPPPVKNREKRAARFSLRPLGAGVTPAARRAGDLISDCRPRLPRIRIASPRREDHMKKADFYRDARRDLTGPLDGVRGEAILIRGRRG